VTERREFNIPDRELVTVINDHAGACLDRPATNSAVLRAGEQKFVVKTDADSEYCSTVANKRELALLLHNLTLLGIWAHVKSKLRTFLECVHNGRSRASRM